MKIVVIGGTGLIGSKTVAILRQGGHEVVAASPKSGINTITGEGLKEAMAGAQVVIDLANSPSRKPPRRDRTGWLTMQSDANGLLTKFPENREFNKEFFNFGPFSAILVPNRRGNPMA